MAVPLLLSGRVVHTWQAKIEHRPSPKRVIQGHLPVQGFEQGRRRPDLSEPKASCPAAAGSNALAGNSSGPNEFGRGGA